MKPIEYFENRIINYDCLKVIPHIPNGSIDLIVTDPPYSLGYEFANDKLSYEKQKEFMDCYCKEFYRVLKPNGTVVIFMSQEMSHYLYFVLKQLTFVWQNEIVWNRDGGQMPTKKLGVCHEMIMIWTKGEQHKTFNLDDIRVQSKYAETDKRLNPKGKNPGDVWYVPALFGKKIERITENGKAIHPTQKPKEIIYPLVSAYSVLNDIVLDPFIGLGTTAIVCKNLGRKYIGIEKDKKYVDVALSLLSEVN